MILDIDFFKKYNDAYGHDTGDKVLAIVASSIKKTVKRAGDFVFRLGGEEFGVILADCDKYSSLLMAQAIRENIENLNIKNINSKIKDNITVSIGLFSANFSKESIDKKGFYTMADSALYQAKHLGRNQVVEYKNTTIDFFLISTFEGSAQ